MATRFARRQMRLQLLLIGSVQIAENFGGEKTLVFLARLDIHGSSVVDWPLVLRN
jgi:hypothetical protein